MSLSGITPAPVHAGGHWPPPLGATGCRQRRFISATRRLAAARSSGDIRAHSAAAASSLTAPLTGEGGPRGTSGGGDLLREDRATESEDPFAAFPASGCGAACSGVLLLSFESNLEESDSSSLLLSSSLYLFLESTVLAPG